MTIAMNMETTTIQVNKSIKELLKSFGRKGETYNEIITKLIERARYVEFMQESYRILDTETNWVKLDEL
jgi:DNA replication protein DnaC